MVALPMALAFGVASGAGAMSGLWGAVLVGLFAALFGGTPTLISEPTGPMTTVMGTLTALPQLIAAARLPEVILAVLTVAIIWFTPSHFS